MSRRAVLAVIAAALLLSSLPYAVAYLSAPADRQFMGIVSSVPDSSQYLAWMRGFSRAPVIENVLTCEPQSPAFFNLQWLALGQASNWVPAPVVLQGFRLLVGFCFLWLTYRVAAAYFHDAEDGAPAWTAWLLINFSSGLGWYFVLEKRVAGLGDARHPLDIYTYEPVSFQDLTVFPHFLLAAALLLLVFRLAVSAIDQKRMAPAWGASLCALALGLAHAYDLIVVYGVLGVFVLCLFVRDGFSWRPLLVAGLIGAISAPPPLYFVYLTTRDPVWRQVLAQFGNAGVFTPSPFHLLILLGVPLLLTLATVRNVFPRRWPASWPLLVRVWAVVNLPLLYIPTDYQIHMLSGWQIPLGLLASEGLFSLVVPRLAASGWMRNGAVARRSALSRRGLVLLVFLVAVPTNVYLLAWRVLEVRKLEHDHYLYRDEIEALTWLDGNSAPGDVVLSSLTLGEYVPFLAGNKVYLGHWAQTVNFEGKRVAVRRFFDGATDDVARRAILAPCRVAYVVQGRAERELGDFDPSRAPYLTLAHVNGETRIYRVDQAAVAAAVAAAAEPPTRSDDRGEATRSTGAWSPPIWLSRRYVSAWFPDIAADSAGGVHVFWAATAGGRDLVAHCLVGSEGCREDDIAGARTSPDGAYNTRPAAAADAQGVLHLLWRSKFDEVYQRLRLPQPDEGWTGLRRLGEGTYSAIAVGGDGVLHAAWTEPRVGAREAEDPCRGCGDIVYSRSADGGEAWSAPIYIAETPTGSQKPAFALGPDHEVYLVWDEGPDFYAGKGEAAPSMVRASLDGGLTWQPSTQFSPEDLPMQPAIAVSGDGTLVAAWRSRTRDGVFAQTSTDRGATWSEPERIPGLLRRHNAPDQLDGMQMAADAAGVVHLVATGRIGPEAEVNGVFHLAWDGHAWTQPEKIFASRGAPEWPRIAIANGNEVAAVWFERDEENVWKSESGQYRIWYAHARVAAPARTPSVWPTPKRVLIRPQTLISLGQALAALLVLAAVIGWARRRGL